MLNEGIELVAYMTLDRCGQIQISRRYGYPVFITFLPYGWMDGTEYHVERSDVKRECGLTNEEVIQLNEICVALDGMFTQ